MQMTCKPSKTIIAEADAVEQTFSDYVDICKHLGSNIILVVGFQGSVLDVLDHGRRRIEDPLRVRSGGLTFEANVYVDCSPHLVSSIPGIMHNHLEDLSCKPSASARVQFDRTAQLRSILSTTNLLLLEPPGAPSGHTADCSTVGIINETISARIHEVAQDIQDHDSAYPAEIEIYVYFDSREYDLDPTWTVDTRPFDLDDIGYPKSALDCPSGRTFSGAPAPGPEPADPASTTVPSGGTT